MKFIKNLFRITPFKLSLTIVLFFTGLSILNDMNPGLLQTVSAVDLRALDIKFMIRGPQPPKSKVVVVAGDEKSFTAFGQWPWNRATVFGALLEKICQYQPKAVGLDIVWSEHEKQIPDHLRPKIEAAFPKLNEILAANSGDKALRKAVESCGSKLVLGYALTNNESEGLPVEEFASRMEITLSKGGNALSTIVKGEAVYPQYPGDPDANIQYYLGAKTGLLNIPEITPETTSQGFFNNSSDNDGNYRHGLLFYRTADYFTSSLTLRMAQKALSPNDTPPTLLVQPQITERNQSEDLKIELNTSEGKREIPIDLYGQIIVNYRGPNLTFPNISVADLLNDDASVEYEYYDTKELVYKKVKQHKSELFKDSLVVVGITAMGLYDIRPRPLDSRAAGVENHASILDNLIANDVIVRPTTDLLLIINIALLVISLLYGVLVTRLEALYGAIVGIIAVVGVLILDQKFLFNRNILFSGHWQAMQFLLQYITITVLKYMQEESDKKFIRSAFDKYVSPAIVNEMIKDPTKLKVGGEKKQLSVMFSDIRGFTTLSERLDAKALTGFLNEYLGAMTDILQKNQGTLDKYIGDAVMGFWGAPIDVENQTTQAVRASVQMMNKLDELNTIFKQKYDGLNIDIGIGINTGEVSVGNFGSSKVFSFTVIGDNVNLASRLENLNKYYGTNIIISEYTQASLKSDPSWNLREIDVVKVKGKKKPVKIFEVFPESPKNAPLKSALSAYNEAMQAYYAQRWDEATKKFDEVLRIRENDKISQEMKDRCKYFSENSPGADWDGSWEMHSK